MTDARRLAVEALMEVLPARGGGTSLREATRSRTAGLPPADRGLFLDLCFGVCRHYRLLDTWLAGQLRKPLRNKARPVQLALLCGLHELWCSQRPSHAVVNAWPDVCRRMRAPWATGLANAVLRAAARTDVDSLRAGMPVEQAFSLPDWLWRMWCEQWPERAEAMARASAQPPPMTLRFNRRLLDREQALARLSEAGIAAQPGRLSPWSLYLDEPLPVEQLPGFRQGWFSVQDEAAQLPVESIQCPPDGRILDACAAPGGKTAQLAERFPDARVVALDRDARRLASVRENLERIGAVASLVEGDATRPEHWWDGEPFDAILVDAPCSATGILRRQPDIKWHRQAADIPELAGLQTRMAGALWPLMRPGGTLVYATCSTLKQENEQVISAFLDDHPGVGEDAAADGFSSASPTGVQLLPEAGDGFFFARLRASES